MLLKNKVILLTKSKSDSNDSLNMLESEGATVVYFPTMKIRSSVNSLEVKQVVEKFAEFDFLIFTSKNAVKVFKNIIDENNLILTHLKVAAVGDSTAELCIQYGIKVDLIPDLFSSKGLINSFSKIYLSGKKILIPCSTLSGENLELGLSNLGANVSSLPVYDVFQNDVNDLIEEINFIKENRPNVFIFTSPSSIENYLKIMNIDDKGIYFNKATICAIGQTTESYLRKISLVVHIVPENSTLENVSKAIIKYFLVIANHA